MENQKNGVDLSATKNSMPLGSPASSRQIVEGDSLREGIFYQGREVRILWVKNGVAAITWKSGGGGLVDYNDLKFQLSKKLHNAPNAQVSDTTKDD